MHKNFFFPLILLLLVLSPLLFSGPTAMELLQRLHSHLKAIKAESEFSRILGGSCLLGLAALYTGIGVNLSISNYNSNPFTDILITVSYTAGGGFAFGALLVFLLPTQYETFPREYSSMPETSSEEIQAKITKGEGYLSSLTLEGKNSRLWRSGIIGVFSIGAFAIYFTTEGDSFSYYLSPKDVSLYGGIFLAGGAILSLIIKSKSENEHDSYIDWKSGKSIATRLDDNNPILELVALSGGIGVTLRY